MVVPLSLHARQITPSYLVIPVATLISQCVHISTGTGTPANKYRCSRGLIPFLLPNFGYGDSVMYMYIHKPLTQEVNISVI